MTCHRPAEWDDHAHDYFHAGFRCVRNRRFDIEPPKEGDAVDFERWRTQAFERVALCKVIDYIQPLIVDQPHKFQHIGLSACCTCGWEERKFWSDTSAKAAWWDHAESLLDFDMIEAEMVMSAFS